MVTLEQNYNRVRFLEQTTLQRMKRKGKNLLNTIEIA